MRDKSILTLIREDAALIAFETALFAFLSASSKVTKSFCSKISMSISKKPKIKVSSWQAGQAEQKVVKAIYHTAKRSTYTKTGVLLQFFSQFVNLHTSW